MQLKCVKIYVVCLTVCIHLYNILLQNATFVPFLMDRLIFTCVESFLGKTTDPLTTAL